MATQLEHFSCQVDTELLQSMREIANSEGKELQTVLEEAITNFIQDKAGRNLHSETMAHFRASVQRNHRLYELLAQ